MEEFLEQGQETLTIIKEQAIAAKVHSEAATKQASVAAKATKFNTWLFSIMLVIILGFVVDTRIEVVKKADASEIQKEYVTKTDALTVHKLETAYTQELFKRHEKGDTLIDESNYEFIISTICDKNYRGNN